MSIKICKRELIRIIVFEIVIFQSILEQYFQIFSYADEIFSLVIFVIGFYYFIKCSNGKVERQFLLFWLCLLLYNFWGWLSSYYCSYRSIYISSVSQFLANEFFLILFGVWSILSYGSLNIEDIITPAVKKIARCDIVVLLVWQAIAMYTKIIPVAGDNELCADLIFCLSVCLISWKGKRDYIYLIFVFGALLCNTSMKAYGSIALILIVYVWCFKRRKKLKIRNLTVMVLALMVLGWGEVKYYLIEGIANSAPRAMLMKYGLDVALNVFPFGTGWGTFGSHYAAKIYSPVYIALGWKNHFTVGEDKYYFLNDIFWPTVYTETGLIGFVFFMLAMILLYFLISRVYSIDYRKYAIGLLIMGYLFLASFTSTSFAHPSTAILAMMLGLVISRSSNTNYE